jgi:hypothetical protein
MQWAAGKTNGWMNYAAGGCDECSKRFVKRSFNPIRIRWERCGMCEVGNIAFTHIEWELYVEMMEEGATLLEQM